MNDLGDIKERVKASADLAEWVRKSGVVLKGGPNEFKGLCPFHAEKTPSFTVNAEKRIWHCFGCGIGGDIFEFVMRKEQVDFMGALKTVGNAVGIALPERRMYQPAEVRASTGSATGASTGSASLDVNKFCALNPEGKVYRYLTEVRKLDGGLLVQYSVGQTVDGEAYVFAYKWTPHPALSPSDGARVRTEFMKVVRVARENGKKVEWREPKGGRNILFGMLAVPAEASELVIAEGEIDAISWAQYGFPAVSVPGGATYLGWIEVCWEWLQRFRKIHISFDEDRAGRAKVVEVVNRLGMARTDIVRLPERTNEQ